MQKIWSLKQTRLTVKYEARASLLLWKVATVAKRNFIFENLNLLFWINLKHHLFRIFTFHNVCLYNEHHLKYFLPSRESLWGLLKSGNIVYHREHERNNRNKKDIIVKISFCLLNNMFLKLNFSWNILQRFIFTRLFIVRIIFPRQIVRILVKWIRLGFFTVRGMHFHFMIRTRLINFSFLFTFSEVNF